MKISRDEIEVKMEIPGAIIRQKRDFGDATGLGKISGEYFSLAAGVDTTPLFTGLEADACQCPHWGYLISGRLISIDANGTEEEVTAKDLFYWPPGHNIKVTEEAELIMFSPQEEHTHVIEHMKKKVNA
ncbi:MAG: cupin domain-containing protein [Salinimicrobium sp.]